MEDRDAAFAAMFERHERALRAFALRRTDDAVLADDLVARAMEVAWRRFDDIELASAFGWMVGVLLRLEANDKRGRRRHDSLVERVVAEAEVSPLVAYLDSDRLLSEQREVIVDAFDLLSDSDREIVRLVVWDGLSDVDLAAALGVAPAAARKRLSRARERFRERYSAASGSEGSSRRRGGDDVG